MATHSNDAEMNNNNDTTGSPCSPPRGEHKKRGQTSTPTSKDSVEPESEEKRAKGSITEISNRCDGSDADDETMEEVNVKKKLPFDDIQENPKTRKDETMVPLPLSDDEEEHGETRKTQKEQDKSDESKEETSGMDIDQDVVEVGFHITVYCE